MVVAVDVAAEQSEVSLTPSIEIRGPANADEGELAERAQALGLHPIAPRLMLARGIGSLDEQKAFIDPLLGRLRPPSTMAGFDAALAELIDARARRVRVGVFGDYDVDGVTSATILATYLEALGVEVVSRVAHREHGYGLGLDDARAFEEARCGLVVTADVGTSDIEAVQALVDRGIRTVVIDHHQVPEVAPPAHAFINPHQAGCGFPFKGLCSAGVAFYLCAALRTRLAQGGESSLPDPRGWLDLVAVATICDMMPLRDENRILVRAGLRHLDRRGRPGLRALLGRAKVDRAERLDEIHVGFKVGPRLNAPGRLGAAEPALRLLRARTDTEAEPLADQVEAINERRRRFTETTVAEAMALLAADPKLDQRSALVVAHHGWLPGVVGIAAAQVAEKYGRPALVLAIDEQAGVARGSVRSTGGVDVRAALGACGDLVDRYGGHAEAAGVTVPAANVDALVEAFDAAVAAQAGVVVDTSDREVVDCTLPLSAVDSELCEALRELGPFGTGFEPPRFHATGLKVERVRVLKEKHIALTVSQDAEQTVRRDAIAFGQAFHGLAPGDVIDCVFVPTIDHFRGEARLKMQIERLWKVPAVS
jgi:single-stranded-DNA-specific exonuclease